MTRRIIPGRVVAWGEILWRGVIRLRLALFRLWKLALFGRFHMRAIVALAVILGRLAARGNRFAAVVLPPSLFGTRPFLKATRRCR
jgi:hypothetical protein